jgi:hypothetical protein
LNIYKFKEDEVLREVAEYLEKTYKSHYVDNNNRQLMEDIVDEGDAIPFCRWNSIKYLRRYGKKNGFNRDDLLKSLHYCIIMLGVTKDNKPHN